MRNLILFLNLSLLASTALAFRPSEGCTKFPFALSENKIQKIMIGAQERTFILETSGPATKSPRPLVLVFHGRDARSEDAVNFGFKKTSLQLSWNPLLVYPQGLATPHAASGWDEHCGSPDQAFVSALVKSIARRTCVDLDRVFAAGFSWGADFTHSLACCLGGNLRAVAALSGSEVTTNPPALCAAGAPAVLIQYGTKDPFYKAADFKITRNFYVQRNACENSFQPMGQGALCVAAKNCRSPLYVCPIPDQGHEVKPEEIVRAVKFLRAY